MEEKTVGQMIAEAREKAGLSKNQLGELAGVSHTEISRIESGEREIPNPKTLRKISKHIGVNYNDLMYAAGLGMQVTPLNPFLKRYYSTLKGAELDEALINTLGSIDNWNALVKSLAGMRSPQCDVLCPCAAAGRGAYRPARGAARAARGLPLYLCG